MTGILGMSSILKEKLKDPENLTMLDYIIASGNRLMKTLNAILELAEEESNIKNLKSVYVTGVAEPIIKEYMIKAEQKGLEFKYDIYDSQLTVQSNDRVLSQIFLHLIDNAVKFTEQGFVQVSISSEKKDETTWAKIVIRDTGIGIMPKDQELIFHEFRQVSEGISRCFEGVGLGLTLVKKMVGLMKGKISLESEIKHGSCFTIYLPAEIMESQAALDEEQTVLIHKPASSAMPAERPDILLVEDNLINIKVIQVYMQNRYNLDYARTGVQAVKMADEKHYDLILMDINLGVGMDGVKAAKAIKSLNGYEETPIVALTGYAMESDKAKLYAEGLTHHLPKPFDKVTLLDFVDSIIYENEKF
jgi:CheY-like chemotaxis protein/two-component sensor histidine kinase